jgi:hypothetical protein
VDHNTAECVGIHAAKPGTRYEALEPLRQGIRAHFGVIGALVAVGLSVRHDHGSQYTSDAFQDELTFWASNRVLPSSEHQKATAALSASSVLSKSSSSGSGHSRTSRSSAARSKSGPPATTASGSSNDTDSSHRNRPGVDTRRQTWQLDFNQPGVSSTGCATQEWDDSWIQEWPEDDYSQFWHRYSALDMGVKDLTACIVGYYLGARQPSLRL